MGKNHQIKEPCTGERISRVYVGDVSANHLVLCSKRTCYSQKPEVRYVEHDDDKEEEFASSDGLSEGRESRCVGCGLCGVS